MSRHTACRTVEQPASALVLRPELPVIRSRRKCFRAGCYGRAAAAGASGGLACTACSLEFPRKAARGSTEGHFFTAKTLKFEYSPVSPPWLRKFRNWGFVQQRV